MLLHIPVFSSYDEVVTDHQLILLFAALESFYSNKNDAPLLVSTNNKDFYDKILEFRFNSGFSFNLEFITKNELNDLFKLPEAILFSPSFLKYFASKFYPVLAKLDRRILHIDYDVIFNNQIDFEVYFEGPITLTSSRVNINAINTGVLGMQQSSFDTISKMLKDPKLFKDAEYKGCKVNLTNDETLIIDLFKRDLMWELELSYDFNKHLLAYELNGLDHWEILPGIIHFHWYKPFNCRVSKGGPNYGSMNMRTIGVYADKIAERFNDAFYKSILMWYQHLKEATKYIPKSINLDFMPSNDNLIYELYRYNLKEGIYYPPLNTGKRKQAI